MLSVKNKPIMLNANYVECRRYAECHYAECRGALITAVKGFIVCTTQIPTFRKRALSLR